MVGGRLAENLRRCLVGGLRYASTMVHVRCALMCIRSLQKKYPPQCIDFGDDATLELEAFCDASNFPIAALTRTELYREAVGGV